MPLASMAHDIGLRLLSPTDLQAALSLLPPRMGLYAACTAHLGEMRSCSGLSVARMSEREQKNKGAWSASGMLGDPLRVSSG